MTSSSNSRRPARTIRRARPLLGTFVEIQATGLPEWALHPAIERAFSAVQRVQELMSFHDARSEISRLNQQAARRSVRVSVWTFQVLSAAKLIASKSKGAFDIAVAPLLQEWGFLPRHHRSAETTACWGATGDIELLPDQRVRYRQPLRIDLGGIAKGFAVDKAVEELQASGVVSGMVNAGGDLRAFGSAPQPIHVRHPGHPGCLIALCMLTDGALATSATYFARRQWHGRHVTPLVDPRRWRPCNRTVSVSVHAPTCLVADALTKVLLTEGRSAVPILRGFSASAFVVTRRGEVLSTEPPDAT